MHFDVVNSISVSPLASFGGNLRICDLYEAVCGCFWLLFGPFVFFCSSQLVFRNILNNLRLLLVD